MSEDNDEKNYIMHQAKFDKNWNNQGAFKDIGPPIRRTQHCAAIYGGCYVVHGGLYGEDNRVLEDFALYDIALGMWVRFKQPKKSKEQNGLIGPRCYHTMTSV